jgi:lipopolysaccharide transport system ATP-binding protein
MSNAIITVESLGKKYQILHQGESRRSTTLREALTLKAASLVRGLTRSNGRRPGGESESASTREEFWALRDVSFEVKQGEVLGVIGRNGAGKSTLLKVLGRITEPTEGRVHMRGRVASLLEVGTGFHPELTGRENVFLNGAILGMSRVEIKRKFDEIVDFSGVEKFLDTPVKRYSSGMYVRLAFAVAAHLEPEILIVDEVLAVGDAQFQKKCLGKMQDVATKEGRTVLFVSHNMTAVRSLCGRIILIKSGQLAGDGLPDEIIQAYVSHGFQELLQRKWDALSAGKSLAKNGLYLKEARIDLDSASEGIIRVDTPFTLSFCVQSEREVTVNLSPHYSLIGGEVIFNAPSPQHELRPGNNWFVCSMPANLLNDGVYSVQVMIVSDSTPIQVVNDALVFEVHDLPRNGAWYGKWPGVVRPLLEWNFSRQSTETI